MRRISETLIRHSLLKPYLESTLQYISVCDWFANNKNISVKEKTLKFLKMLSVICIFLAGYSKSKECSKVNIFQINIYINLF